MAVGFKPYHGGGGAESKAVGFDLTESKAVGFDILMGTD